MDDEIELMGDDEIELISDGEGLAVIGEPTAVERFLRRAGLWKASTELDLQRLAAPLGKGANLVRAASEIAASSGRYIKLTKESAQLVKEHGLMPTETPGVSHLMIGKPGSIKGWLQSDQTIGSKFTNPATLSGVAGLMAQVADQQAMAEISAYLKMIDVKLDEVSKKVDDQAVARMMGAGMTLQDALTVWEVTGCVTDDTWAKLAGTEAMTNESRGYALLQLNTIAGKFEAIAKTFKGERKAKTIEKLVVEVQDWLAVLARCSELQIMIDVFELDRMLAASPDELDRHRLALSTKRQKRLGNIEGCTKPLLERISAACDMANAKMIWNRTNALALVQSGNHVAAKVHGLHEILGIESVLQSYEERELGLAAKMGAQVIQSSKDKAPAVAKTAGGLFSFGVVAYAGYHKIQDRGSSS